MLNIECSTGVGSLQARGCGFARNRVERKCGIGIPACGVFVEKFKVAGASRSQAVLVRKRWCCRLRIFDSAKFIQPIHRQECLCHVCSDEAVSSSRTSNLAGQIRYGKRLTTDEPDGHELAKRQSFF